MLLVQLIIQVCDIAQDPWLCQKLENFFLVLVIKTLKDDLLQYKISIARVDSIVSVMKSFKVYHFFTTLQFFATFCRSE